jgi:hypothetical protein
VTIVKNIHVNSNLGYVELYSDGLQTNEMLWKIAFGPKPMQISGDPLSQSQLQRDASYTFAVSCVSRNMAHVP